MGLFYTSLLDSPYVLLFVKINTIQALALAAKLLQAFKFRPRPPLAFNGSVRQLCLSFVNNLHLTRQGFSYISQLPFSSPTQLLLRHAHPPSSSSVIFLFAPLLNSSFANNLFPYPYSVTHLQNTHLCKIGSKFSPFSNLSHSSRYLFKWSGSPKATAAQRVESAVLGYRSTRFPLLVQSLMQIHSATKRNQAVRNADAAAVHVQVTEEG